ncbi:MAG: hypothetical protein ACYSTF_03085 [Planctomycetota bacterium]
MTKREAKTKRRSFLFLTSIFFVLYGSCCLGEEGLDRRKYIGLDEIRPGMRAYCLTSYKGTEIERFDLEVLSVVRKLGPAVPPRPSSRDAILVQGTDERFIHTGPVAGCSGSPVYIDGRLAGALAFGWYFSKDPLYGVTPIEEMLKVGEVTIDAGQSAFGPGYVFDYSVPIDLAAIDKQITTPRASSRSSLMGAAILPSPLIVSGLPPAVCEQLDTLVEPFGLMAVPSIGGSADHKGAVDAQLVPGACLSVPLVSGDIAVEAIGTVTEVVGDQVYGFGHSFYGHGPVDLPMATGQVHTVVSSTYRSFKFASTVEIVGALRADESAAVRGQIGAKARMVPFRIAVERYNDAESKVYTCQMVHHRLLTPLLVRVAVAGAAVMLGWLPPDHMIEYKVSIGIEDSEPVAFENVSTSLGLDEIIIESAVPVAILMNNPYKKLNINSVEIDIRIVPKKTVSRLWSVSLSDSKVRAGEGIELEMVVESFLAAKKKYDGRLTIPDGLEPGKYDLIVCGAYDYEKFLRKAAPYRFVPENLSSLIKALNEILAVKRDRLYYLLVLPPSGVTVERAELPDLPATKALVLRDAKRTLRAQPYQQWVERSIHTGTVIVGRKVMQVTVEK